MSVRHKLDLQSSPSGVWRIEFTERPNTTLTVYDDDDNNCNNNQMQSTKVDILSALKNYPHVLDKVFSYLRPQDLRVVPCVSRSWRFICYRMVPSANRRRLKALRRLRRKKRQVGSENWPIDCKCAVLKKRLKLEREKAYLMSNVRASNQPPSRTEQAQTPPQQSPHNIASVANQLQSSRSRRTLSSIQNLVTTNYQPTTKAIFRSHRISSDYDQESQKFRSPKSKKWVLARAPFKNW